ncbi:MAG: hypothetical protein CVU44_05690 [Chloroflexi bacterium HGW-Chloroflexi-6]|nr:MAG: hypothetical protein CVU44_05690 [Chloroflexi bacterium HGW-Chloroflexi-6]
MNIGEILSKSWQIIWKFKILWIFGILASCVEGGGGGGSGGGGGGDSGFNGEDLGLPIEGWVNDFVRYFENFESHPEQYIGLIAIILMVFCVLWLLALALGTMGRIGLIKGALLGDQNTESLSFAELWQESTPYFWKVLGLWLIMWLASFVLVALIVLVFGLGAALTMGILALCLIPLLCLFIPLSWLANLLFEQATIAMIKEERSASDALQRAWQLFRANLSNYLIMALLLFIIQLAVGALLSLPIFLIVIPAMFGLALGIDQGMRTTLIISGLCFVVYIPVLIILGGILRAYVWTAWTLTFTRLSASPLPPPAQPEMLDAY